MADVALVEGFGLSPLFTGSPNTNPLPDGFAWLGWQVLRGTSTSTTAHPAVSLVETNKRRVLKVKAISNTSGLGVFVYRRVRKLSGRMVLGFSVTDTWKDTYAANSYNSPTQAAVGLYASSTADISGTNLMPVFVRRGNDGLLQLGFRTTTSTNSLKSAVADVFLAGTENWIELVIDFTNGKIELWCNSKLAATVTPTSAEMSSLQANSFWYVGLGYSGFGAVCQYGFTGEINAGPLYVADTRLGRCQTRTQFPTEDAAIAWSRETGDSNFALVADRNGPDGDGSYVSAMMTGATDLYRSSDPLNLGNERVHAVSVTVLARKEDVGTKQIAAAIKDASATQSSVGDSSVLSLNSYSAAQTVWSNNPRTGAPWTAADMAGLQFGARLTE